MQKQKCNALKDVQKAKFWKVLASYEKQFLEEKPSYANAVAMINNSLGGDFTVTVANLKQALAAGIIPTWTEARMRGFKAGVVSEITKALEELRQENKAIKATLADLAAKLKAATPTTLSAVAAAVEPDFKLVNGTRR